MTTPNTEPKPRPATDAEIARLLSALKAYPVDDSPADSDIADTGVTPRILIARIEQEREIRREAETLIWAADIAASSSGRNTFAHECKSFLARAAKMEEETK